MGFSAMLAEEYKINCINFTQQRFGLNIHGISAQQKALTVGGNPIDQTAKTEQLVTP
jgi:hypothetical protein